MEHLILWSRPDRASLSGSMQAKSFFGLLTRVQIGYAVISVEANGLKAPCESSPA